MKYLILTLLLFFNTAFAQQIYFCATNTEDGRPVSASNNWKIKARGGYLTVLFDNEKLITSKLINVNIQKDKGVIYEQIDKKSLSPGKEKKWAAFSYVFKEAGKYKFTFSDANSKFLASGTVIINIEEAIVSLPKEIKINTEKTDMFFCELVFQDKPVRQRAQFAITENNGLVFVYFKSNFPINTDLLELEIHRKTVVEDKESLYELKSYEAKPAWLFTYFRYKFVETGYYTFYLFDKNKKLLNSCKLIITN